MFIRWISKHFSPILYLQIQKEKLKVTEVYSGKTYEDIPSIVIKDERVTIIGKKGHIRDMSQCRSKRDNDL
jgi:hypothetical protein